MQGAAVLFKQCKLIKLASSEMLHAPACEQSESATDEKSQNAVIDSFGSRWKNRNAQLSFIAFEDIRSLKASAPVGAYELY